MRVLLDFVRPCGKERTLTQNFVTRQRGRTRRTWVAHTSSDTNLQLLYLHLAKCASSPVISRPGTLCHYIARHLKKESPTITVRGSATYAPRVRFRRVCYTLNIKIPARFQRQAAELAFSEEAPPEEAPAARDPSCNRGRMIYRGNE